MSSISNHTHQPTCLQRFMNCFRTRPEESTIRLINSTQEVPGFQAERSRITNIETILSSVTNNSQDCNPIRIAGRSEIIQIPETREATISSIALEGISPRTKKGVEFEVMKPSGHCDTISRLEEELEVTPKLQNRLGEVYAKSDLEHKLVRFEGTGEFTHQPCENQLLQSVLTAWNTHSSLRLSPDVLFMVILQGLSIHINKDPQRFREQLVSWEGKKELVSETDYPLKQIPQEEWSSIVLDFSQQIEKNTLPKSVSSMSLQFSTQKDKLHRIVAQNIILMDSVKEFFSSRFNTMCGIPSIALEGTVDDWKLLCENFNQICDQFDLNSWKESLTPVLNKFYEASTGKEDKDFFSKIYSAYAGSGGPMKPIGGWIRLFFPYVRLKDRSTGEVDYQPNSFRSGQYEFEEFPSSIANVPFIHTHNGSNPTELSFTGGIIGVGIDGKKRITPSTGWAITKRTSDPLPVHYYNNLAATHLKRRRIELPKNEANKVFLSENNLLLSENGIVSIVFKVNYSGVEYEFNQAEGLFLSSSFDKFNAQELIKLVNEGEAEISVKIPFHQIR